MAGYSGYPRPELADIRSRVYADITNKLPGQDASIAYTPLNALAEAVIGATYELYGYIDWSARQTNVLDCEDENLNKYGEIWSIARKSAAYATGTVTFTGTNGSVIPEGSVLVSTGNLQYKTTAEYTIASGTATANVKSVLPGISQNLPVGTVLTTNDAIAGVNASVTVVLISGGSDTEPDALYRQRLLDRISQPPQGGAALDYVAWAKEVPGVTRAWCYPEELGVGEVTVRFMRDDDAGNDGIPVAGDVTAVYDHINPLRPVTATLTVVAPVASALNVTVNGLYPNTSETQAAAVAEIRDMIRTKAEPGGTIHISWIWEAVSLATGTNYHKITSPANDTSYANGVIAIPGTISFT
jgi:uncharacterized phage protein gp47/JayE